LEIRVYVRVAADTDESPTSLNKIESLCDSHPPAFIIKSGAELTGPEEGGTLAEP
jgi:hypothetical protein